MTSCYFFHIPEPHAGFRIAFNMFDADGNEMVDKREFMVVWVPSSPLLITCSIQSTHSKLRTASFLSLTSWRRFFAKRRTRRRQKTGKDWICRYHLILFIYLSKMLPVREVSFHLIRFSLIHLRNKHCYSYKYYVIKCCPVKDQDQKFQSDMQL